MAPLKGTEHIPAAPFAEWLNQRLGIIAARLDNFEDACSILAHEIGFDDVSRAAGIRRLYRYRHQLKAGSINGVKCDHPTDVFPRMIVQEALHCVGLRLGDLYPYEALVDEFVLEYDVPRDQAQHLADAWIERTWHTVWERAGLFVLPEHRRQRYCRDCHRTTRVFAGVCEECMAPDHAVMVGAVA